MRMKLLLGVALTTAPLTAGAVTPIAGVRNVIILINDGAGFAVYDATRLYLGKRLAVDGPGFRKTAVSTYPLRPDSLTNNKPGATAQDPATVYDPARFWDTTPVTGLSVVPGYNVPALAPAGFAVIPGPLYPAGFKGYEFSRLAHPDSANTASAIATGIKSYNNAVNVDGHGEPQLAITDMIAAAKQSGRATGVVTTVQFSDATPAALGGAHNIARINHGEIADEMFGSGKLDVIGGTGNPDFNDDGQPRPPVYAYLPDGKINPFGWIAAPLWTDLKAGTNASGRNAAKWTLYQSKGDIEALAAGTMAPPKRLAMIMQSDTSSQFNRTNTVPGIAATADTVYGTPLKRSVPTQATLTLAALNALDRRGRGFYLMTEAGAVDRAEHANDTARVIEEMIASQDTVRAIIDWVNRPGTAATWKNTLLIVTADHDHLLYGPDGETVPFQPLKDRGAGKVPGNKWFGPNHGTGLVPLFAYGRGAAEVVALANRTDRYTDARGRRFGHGRYLDQTQLGALLKATLGR